MFWPNSLIEILLVLLVLTNFFMLGSSRLGIYVRLVAIQGLILGAIPLLVNSDELTSRVVFIAVVSTLIKSGFFPWLFMRTIRVVHIKREIEPLVGYSISLLLGLLAFGFSMWLSARLPLTNPEFSSLVVPVAFFTMFSGSLLIATRNKAITQAISYLVIENGIYLFGMTFVENAPLLIEVGILLDVVVGIFVMGITINHINQEFGSLNVKNLTHLNDWGS